MLRSKLLKHKAKQGLCVMLRLKKILTVFYLFFWASKAVKTKITIYVCVFLFFSYQYNNTYIIQLQPTLHGGFGLYHIVTHRITLHTNLITI